MEQKRERKRTVSKKLAKITAIFTIALCSITFVVALMTAIASGAAMLVCLIGRINISDHTFYILGSSLIFMLLEVMLERKIFKDYIVEKLKKKQFFVVYYAIMLIVVAVILYWRGGQLNNATSMLFAWLFTIMGFNIIISLLKKECYCV